MNQPLKNINCLMVPVVPEKFKYILVPCDASFPIHEREYTQVQLENDTFIKMIKEYFASSSPESNVDRALLLQQMSQHAKQDIARAVDSETLKEVLMMTSVDIMSVALPTQENRFQGISLYVDDKGRSKNLPLNERAGFLGLACGLVGQTFHGDVFLSRVYDDGDENWFRMNFTLSDVSSSAEWVVRAAEQAKRKVASGATSLSGLADQFLRQSGSAPAVVHEDMPERAIMGGSTDKYEWTQTRDEVEVTIATTATRKQVQVEIKMTRIRIIIAGDVVIDSELFGSVETDESTWTLSDGRVQISLGKKTSANWDRLLK